MERLGAQALDLPCPEASDLDSEEPFKGNIDLEALKNVLSGPDGHRVGQILLTITNNGGGGQPVSIANIEAASAIARSHGVPLILDAARFAENAWLAVGYPVDDSYLTVILSSGDPGATLYVEVAGHDGVDHADDAVAVVKAVLAQLH